MIQWTMRKVVICLLAVFVTLGLNLPVVEAIAAPVQSQSMMTMDMSVKAMKGVAGSTSKGACPHCPDMGGVPAMNCGLPCIPLDGDDSQIEFKRAAASSTTYVIAERALTGRNFAPETGPPRTLAHV